MRKLKKTYQKFLIGIAFLIVTMILTVGFPRFDKVEAKKALLKENYKVVSLKGIGYKSRYKHTDLGLKFIAVSSKGDTVRGIVVESFIFSSHLEIDD